MTSRRGRPYAFIAFGAALVAAAVCVVLSVNALLVLFGGFLFALVLRGLTDVAATHVRLPRGVCLAAVVLALVGAMVAFVVVAGPRVVDEVVELMKRLPEAARVLVERIRHTPIAQDLPSADALPDTKAMGTHAVAALGSSLEALGAFVVIFFVGVYGAARPGDYARAVVAIAPERHRTRVGRALEESSRQVTRWLLGRLVAMLFVGISCAIAFAVLHVPLALTLAVIAGLLTFVEYVGAVVSAIPPVLLAFTRSPMTAVWVLVLFTVLHVIEGYVLTPLLARAAVRLPPAFTLAGQLVLASLVGPLGLTFSTPLLVVVVAAVRTWREAEGDAGERSTGHVARGGVRLEAT